MKSGLTAFHIVVHDDAVFFCPAFYLRIGNSRVSSDRTKSCGRKNEMSVSLLSPWRENKGHTKPEDGEDSNPEEFPPGLGDGA